VNTNGKRKLQMVVESKNFNGTPVTVAFWDRVTMAIANINGTEGVGLALCMKGDKYSRDIGAGIAAARAIRNIADTMEEAWMERSITYTDWKEKHKKG
jgi:hypothetical protein